MIAAVGADTTVQQLLDEAVSGGSLRRAYLVRSRSRANGSAVSIVAHAPAEIALPRVASHTMRWVVRSAVATARTLVLAGNTLDSNGTDDTDVLCATPLVLESGEIWGALVGVDGGSRPYVQTIHSVERIARQLAACELPEQAPVAGARKPRREKADADRLKGSPWPALLHELRTPLAAASYALDEIARVNDGVANAGPEQVTRMLRTAQLGVTEAQNLVRYFSQLRIVRSVMQPTIEAVSIENAIDRALSLLPTARVRVVIDEPVPPVAADRVWLIQVLTNLLENAATHGHSSDPAVVSVKRATPKHLLVSVTDSGPGIPPDQLREVFRPGVRATVADDLTSQGLGLSIARHLVAAMGGELWVESDGINGTGFSFTVPAASDQPESFM